MTDQQIHLARDVFRQQFELAGESTAYHTERANLLTRDRAHAWDAPARSRASQAEIDANRILIKIREHERQDEELFGNKASEEVPDPKTRDMGGRFLVCKDRIERSKVFKIASEMPKGAHLHLHFNTELPPEKLFPHARRQEMEKTMFIRSTKSLCKPTDFVETEIVFGVHPEDTKRANIFSPDYRPNHKDPESTTWMRWVDFCRQFPAGIPLENPAEDCEELLFAAEYWAREKMIMTSCKVYNHRQTTNGIWACFNQSTRAFKGLMNYEGVYRWYIGNAIESMIKDRVMYAELRPMLLDKSIPSNDGKRKLDLKAQMSIICEEYQRKREELEARGELHLFPFGPKIIYCTPRSLRPEIMETELQDCINLKLQFPDLICGFDLVGAEDRPFHIGHYADLLVAFTNTCRELGISIPFMFHAGESLLDTGGTSNPDNSNLYDSLLLNAKRIGHGYALLKHPVLVEQFRKRKICLELCPISNELLHLCGNVRQHIFPELLAAGLQCTLNADNPSLFRESSLHCASLAYEFYQVMVGDTRMSIHGWKQLAEWSIEHSCLERYQKDQAAGTFANQWEEFCQRIVTAYGPYAEGLDES